MTSRILISSVTLPIAVVENLPDTERHEIPYPDRSSLEPE